MKILLVSLSNRGGGAARAIDSLAKVLVKRGEQVEVLVFEGEKTSEYPIRLLTDNRWRMLCFRIKNKLVRWFMNRFDNPSHDYRSINLFPSPMLKAINESDADVVHLHWIGGEMMSISQMAKIKKPVVWTMHDQWLMQGCYHINPIHYEPYQIAPPSNWLDRWVLGRKKKAFKEVKYYFTSPSLWMKEYFDYSYLNNGHSQCSVIRNYIDTKEWHPISKPEARAMLGFDESKRHILFIASGKLLESFNKGYRHVQKLLEMCKEDPYVFHFVGASIEVDYDNVITHGRVNGASELIKYYSACDVTLQPSFWENMSYVGVESVLCGTPLLGFDTTGVGEFIQQGVNGYKAKKFDVEDMYLGLKQLLNTKFETLVEETVPDYLPELNINRYLDLYKKAVRE